MTRGGNPKPLSGVDMVMKTLFILLALSVCVLVLPGRAAIAKGPVDAIEFTGPTLARPIEVTQGDALLTFSPWGQRFLGERLDASPDVSDGLTVTMYLGDKDGVPTPLYRFTYYSQDGGVIYLPGPGDTDYPLNETTILSQNDGHWFRAAPEWQAFVQGLTQIQPPATGSGGLK
jgi:hypothetical protein